VSPVSEAFEAYFRLWEHGFRCDFRTPGVVTVGAAA
jgi:hypothetical protein